MGMYDELICEYPLPLDGMNHLKFQTKDTPAQFLDLYKIDKDGHLWHEIYDIKDKSDPNAEGPRRLFGCMARVNKRWEKSNFTGEIRFYTTIGDNHKGWIEFSSIFLCGKLDKLELVEHKT